MSKNGQTMNAQGCGQIWDNDFPSNLFSKRECKTNNCNYVFRLGKVNSCYSYTAIRDKKNQFLYKFGNSSTQKCEK